MQLENKLSKDEQSLSKIMHDFLAVDEECGLNDCIANNIILVGIILVGMSLRCFIDHCKCESLVFMYIGPLPLQCPGFW